MRSSSSRSSALTASCSAASARSSSPSARGRVLQRLGLGGVAVACAAAPTCFDSSFTSRRISSRSAGDVAEPLVERGRRRQLVEQRRVVAPGERRAHGVGIGSEQADVDHSVVRLPAAIRFGPEGSRLRPVGLR